MLGAGRPDENYSDYKTAVKAGKIFGDLLSVITGSIEVAGGALMMGAGTIVSSTGVLTVVGAPAVAGGAVVTVHGLSVFSSVISGNIRDFMQSDDGDSDGSGNSRIQKDKQFRPGKQNKRDKDIKEYEKDFQRWYHKGYKKKGDRDASREELEDLYQEWIRQGKPKVK